MQDNALLTQYAHGSEAAFSQLLARHLPLVYGTCRRELGSEVLAEDAAQVVFLLLARKAKILRAGSSLAGWLYQTAVFVAKDVRKQESRRIRREEAAMQEAIHTYTAPTPEWDSVEPLLNAALSSLKPADRDAVLLRFLAGYTLAETGALLGVTEDAARMRVARALDKLRRYLTAHGAAVTGLALTGFLTTEAAHPIPAHAAEAISQGTLQAISGTLSPNVLLLSKGVSRTMKVIKVKYAALAAAVLIAGASIPPLAHAPNRRQTVRQAAPSVPLSLMRRQAFQVGMTAQGRDLQGEDFISGVSNISRIPNAVSVNAETDEYSREIPEYRSAQSRAYQQTFAVLNQMNAPAAVSVWYAQASHRFSGPLVVPQEIKEQAQAAYVSSSAYMASQNDNIPPATESQLTDDLAQMAEMKEVRIESAAQRSKVATWLERSSPAAAWDARLGSYAVMLSYRSSVPCAISKSEFIADANSLLQTVPANTPVAVSETLHTLILGLNGLPSAGASGYVLIVPKIGTNSANAAQQQLSRAYNSLCSAYGVSLTGQ